MRTALILFLAYSAVLVGVSLWASGGLRRGSSGDFLYARGRLSAPLVAVTVACTGVGGVATIGIAEVAYSGGLSAANYNIAWAASSILAGFLFIPRLQRIRVKTLPEMMALVFGPLAGRISLFIQFFLLTTLVAAQYVAGASILTSLFSELFSTDAAMLICALLFILITLLGGYRGVSLTNILNVTVILLGLLFGAALLLIRSGGLGSLIGRLPADTDWTHPVRGIGLSQFMVWYVTAFFSKLGNQSVIHSVFSARDNRAARRGYILAGFLVAPVGPLAAIFGLAARADFPALADHATALPMAAAQLNPVISGLTLVAIFAAVVSTASGTLLSSAALLEPMLSRRSSKPLHKVALLVIVLMTLFIARFVDGLLDFGMFCAALLAPYSILMVCVLYAPGLLRRSTMTVTMGVALGIQTLWLVPSVAALSPVIYVHIASAALCILLCRVLDPRRVDTEVLFYKDVPQP